MGIILLGFGDLFTLQSYVDQEDAFLPKLTVFETVLYAALLRLPSDMDMQMKYERVYTALIELDILHLAHQRVGGSSSICFHLYVVF